ncbi:MAG: hypothetical protein ACYC23_24920, partial [Limisphaerales bacterium]
PRTRYVATPESAVLHTITATASALGFDVALVVVAMFQLQANGSVGVSFFRIHVSARSKPYPRGRDCELAAVLGFRRRRC